jgi:hypothetical protein
MLRICGKVGWSAGKLCNSKMFHAVGFEVKFRVRLNVIEQIPNSIISSSLMHFLCSPSKAARAAAYRALRHWSISSANVSTLLDLRMDIFILRQV